MSVSIANFSKLQVSEQPFYSHSKIEIILDLCHIAAIGDAFCCIVRYDICRHLSSCKRCFNINHSRDILLVREDLSRFFSTEQIAKDS